MSTLGEASKGANLDLKLRQGATFGPHSMQIFSSGTTPQNLTGAVFRGQIRKTFDAATVAATLSFTILDAAQGTFSWNIPASVTAAMPAGSSETDALSQYVWDMEVEFPTTPVTVTALLYGDVSVFREVTRS